MVDPFNGNTFKWGSRQELGVRVGKIRTQINTMLHDIMSVELSGKQIQARKKKIQKLYKNISNIIEDHHRVMVKFLLENYSLIIIPEFDVKSMVAKGGDLMSSDVKDIMTWAHYKFRMRLFFTIQKFLVTQ